MQFIQPLSVALKSKLSKYVSEKLFSPNFFVPGIFSFFDKSVKHAYYVQIPAGHLKHACHIIYNSVYGRLAAVQVRILVEDVPEEQK